MHRIVLRSKIHRATVTRASVDYEGSCSIDVDLLRRADIWPGEQVHIVNVTNGSRAVTYAIAGAPGEVGLNGAMAHIGAVGDVVIIMSYAHCDDEELATFAPTLVRVDVRNRPLDGGRPAEEEEVAAFETLTVP